MTKLHTAYNQQSYSSRISQHLNKPKNTDHSLESVKEKLNAVLNESISQKLKAKGLATEEQLTDNDYREILEQLHAIPELHSALVDSGIKSVSNHSFYSNQRATGKKPRHCYS